MINFIISAIKIIVMLGLLVTIHEAGHFIAAKLSKVKVKNFSIGFGPTILKKQGKETLYALRLIPLGGFVSMEGEEGDSEDSRSFAKASMPKKMAIVLAGSIVNILFAIIVFFTISMTSGTYISNTINNVYDDYAAKEVGLQVNDKIVEINGKTINSKKDIDNAVDRYSSSQIELVVSRNGENISYSIIPTEVKAIVTGIYLDQEANVVAIEENSIAEKSGLIENDKIINVNGIEVQDNGEKVIEILSNSSSDSENQPIKMTILRNDNTVEIEIVPEYISLYYMGVEFSNAPDTFANRLIHGGMETELFLSSMIENLQMLITGNVSPNQMMGIVGISDVVAQTNGVVEFLKTTAIISLSLGITNLLPIPALDGGKMIILWIELIRRKPMKKETEIKIQLIGFSLLLMLTIYVTYNDILRVF